MPAWRCPHCGTPQPEAARCWVCHRSTTCCATCRHFRPAVATGLGFCGLDRRRLPLLGVEIRPCWAGSIRPLLEDTIPARPAAPAPRRQALVFVPVASSSSAPAGGAVEEGAVASRVGADAPDQRPAMPASGGGMINIGPQGWTLWGDAFL